MSGRVMNISELKSFPIEGQQGLTWRPIRREFDIRAFGVNPQEHADADLDQLEGERVVLYVESDGTILDASDPEFADYERQTGEWSEIVKIYSDEDE